MIANVLKSEGLNFEVMTPAGGARLQSERNREDAIEMYYNASVTSWLNATVDLQIIEPALTKTLSSSGLENADTAVVAGLRLYMRF